MRTCTVHALLESEGVFTQQRRFPLQNLPQWFVRNCSCIPTTTGHLLPSVQTFSSDLRSIAGRYLPVFVCETRTPRPDLWQIFFGFKTQLEIADYLAILTSVYQQSIMNKLTDEDTGYIQTIYTALINRLSTMKPADRAGFRVSTAFFLLSTHENKFLRSTELVLSIDPALIVPPGVPQLRLNEINTRHVHLKLLLDLFSIQKVTMNDLSLKKDLHKQVSHSLQTKLRDIQPYLFALTDSKSISDHKIDRDLEIFEADQLELFFKNDILIDQVSVHLETNQLYIKRPWNSDETMIRLPSILCQFFKLPADFESEVKLLLLTSTLKEINDRFIERNIPLQSHHFLDDLLNTGGTRDKFANLIDRDNAKLFSHLKENKKMSSAELLIQGLNVQDSPWTGHVYHFTHLENVQKILTERKLKARGLLNTDDFHDSAAATVIRSTRAAVKNHVRFYFRPLTPTQRCNENLGVTSLAERYGNKLMCPVPVFFRFNLRSLLAIKNLSWNISLGNLASQHTEFGSTKKTVKKFDFQYVYADTRTERGKFSSQHEFLIESELDLNLLKDEDIKLIVQDENSRSTLIHLVDPMNYQIEIDSRYFFGYNPRVVIDNSGETQSKITIKIDYGMETNDPGKLFVQITSKNPTKTITGNLIGIFERDGVLSVLGKDQIAFVPEMNDVEFAVYYKYTKQTWLIYTNYKNPIFKSPSKES